MEFVFKAGAVVDVDALVKKLATAIEKNEVKFSVEIDGKKIEAKGFAAAAVDVTSGVVSLPGNDVKAQLTAGIAAAKLAMIAARCSDARARRADPDCVGADAIECSKCACLKTPVEAPCAADDQTWCTANLATGMNCMQYVLCPQDGVDACTGLKQALAAAEKALADHNAVVSSNAATTASYAVAAAAAAAAMFL